MKKVAIMQPYLFPYIGYFQTMNAVDEYVIYDDVQFIKGGWINRNNLLSSGHKNLFTIQLQDASPNKLINEIEIKDDFAKFKRTISMPYSKAPYNKPVTELVYRICSFSSKNLAQFIGNSLEEISQYLGMNTRLTFSSSLQKDNSLKAQEKVIAICKELKTDVYINAIGGQELYSKKDFNAHQIDLKFLKTLPIKYKQFNNEFVPWLSIIDVMMFNSPEEVREMLENYELI